MKRIARYFMIFCTMFSLWGTTALASEDSEMVTDNIVPFEELEAEPLPAEESDSSIPDDVATTDDIFSYWVDGENATIVKYKGDDSVLYIPETLDGYTVTGIRNGAFKECDSLTKVVIPDSVTWIGDLAFWNCISLSEVVLPEGLTSIEGGVFQGSGLTKIVIPDSVERIEDDAFYECTSLSSVTLPESLTFMGSHAFAYCYSLESIEIPKNLTETDGWAFVGCYDLESASFEEGTTTIAGKLFAECPGLKEVTIPEGVTSIGYSAFYECTHIEKIVLPDSVTEIGNYAFQGCSKLSEIALPDGITSIGGYAFAYTSLNSVVLPKSLTKLGSYAFTYCDDLTSVEIPKSLTDTGAWIFGNCDKLKNVNFEEGITVIPFSLFATCSGLEKIEIPDTVVEIKGYAFSKCENLQEIIMPDSVEYIGGKAFEGCTQLSNITLPKSLYYIGEQAFQDCTALTSVEIPKSLEYAGEKVFSGCDNLVTVSFENGVTKIIGNLFSECSSLERIEIPDTVTIIESAAFQDCENLKEVIIPDSVETIEHKAFAGCTSLQKIDIPYGVIEIKDNVFTDCSGLTEVAIPRTTVTIGSDVFSNPENMTIYGITGTYAEEYANEIGAAFVNREIPATAVSLNMQELELNKYGSKNLAITVEPDNFTDAIVWTSSNEEVAWIVENCRNCEVHAGIGGTADILVTVGKQSVVCKVTVFQPVTEISLSEKSLALETGDSHTLTAEVLPDNASNKTVTWSSSNEAIVTVDKNGQVTAVAVGEAKIIATSQDGSNITAECAVSVSEAVEPPVHIENPWDGTADTSWYQENILSFEISTPQQLAGLGELVNSGISFEGKTVYLVNDIFLNDESYEYEWIPIESWNGTFHGNGHTIYYMKVSMEERGGLFETIEESGIVKAVNVSQGILDAGGCIANYNLGYIAFCNNYSSVWSDEWSVGGICNDNRNLVYGCKNYGEVLGYYAGGIVGENREVTAVVSQCSNWGKVNGDDETSGIAAYNYGWIYNCYNRGELTCYSSRGGMSGIVNDNSQGNDVESCYSIGTYICDRQLRQGIHSISSQGKSSKVVNCYTMPTANVTADATVLSGAEMKRADFVDKLNCQTNTVLTAWTSDTANMNDGYPITVADYNYLKGIYKIQPELWTTTRKKITLEVGDTENIRCSFYYNEKAPVISVEDNKIAAVTYSNKQIVVEALKSGSTYLNIHFEETENCISADYRIQLVVTNSVTSVESVSLNKSELSLEQGVTDTINASVLPSTATNRDVTWKSSNELIARVNAYGQVTGIAVGTTVITAVAQDGSGVSASCTVTVTEPNPETANNPFSDVAVSSWQYPYAKAALETGIMSGKGIEPNGRIIFDPNNNMTRAEFVQTLYNKEGKPAVSYTAKFADVPDGQWYTNAILWAAENNIVAGKGDKFDVNGQITRQEMATILYKYAANYKGYETSGRTEFDGYTDAYSISSWATENMRWALKYGIMKGKGERIAPLENATRAECATMLKNFMDAYE